MLLEPNKFLMTENFKKYQPLKKLYYFIIPKMKLQLASSIS